MMQQEAGLGGGTDAASDACACFLDLLAKLWLRETTVQG